MEEQPTRYACDAAERQEAKPGRWPEPWPVQLGKTKKYELAWLEPLANVCVLQYHKPKHLRINHMGKGPSNKCHGHQRQGYLALSDAKGILVSVV